MASQRTFSTHYLSLGVLMLVLSSVSSEQGWMCADRCSPRCMHARGADRCAAARRCTLQQGAQLPVRAERQRLQALCEWCCATVHWCAPLYVPTFSPRLCTTPVSEDCNHLCFLYVLFKLVLCISIQVYYCVHFHLEPALGFCDL